MIQKYIYLFEPVFKTIELVLFLGAFFLLNLHSFLGSRQFPDVVLFTGAAWRIVPGVLVALLLVAVLIYIRGITRDTLDIWRRNLALIVFLLVAILSLFWSVYIAATLYKLIYLLLATILGAYIAIRFRFEEVINLITGAAILSILLSLVLLIFIPNAIMMNEPYIGSWRGMFWHRNHAGDLNAYFNAVFLFRILFLPAKGLGGRMLMIVFYLLSIALVIGSNSATGVVVFLVLHSLSFAGFAWLKWQSRFKRWHYIAMAGLLVLGGFIFLTNTAFFIGLLGRSSNLTGRIPLWRDLLFNIWTQKPWLGYGYGALWMQESFRDLMKDRQGWIPFPVFFSDNGFLDILLNTGLAGFIPFAVMYLTRWKQSLSFAIKTKERIYFFLPLTFFYVFVGNLSYSFLLEVDQFVWSLLVIALFATTRYATSPLPAKT